MNEGCALIVGVIERLYGRSVEVLHKHVFAIRSVALIGAKQIAKTMVLDVDALSAYRGDLPKQLLFGSELQEVEAVNVNSHCSSGSVEQHCEAIKVDRGNKGPKR